MTHRTTEPETQTPNPDNFPLGTGLQASPASTPEPDTPRIYVACLAAYNNGHLHGVWIDLGDDADEDFVWETIKAMLAKSPIPNAEEHAIHDYEYFQGAEIHEYDSIGRVLDIARFIRDTGELGGELLQHFGGELSEAEDALEDYAGEYQSLAEFVEELTDYTNVPANLVPYIDYDRMANDLKLSGDIFTIETAHDQVHVFWSR